MAQCVSIFLRHHLRIRCHDRLIAGVGRSTLSQLSDLGATLILMQAIFGRSNVGVHWHLTIDQIHVVGVLSLSIIIVSGLFIGMVLGLQRYTILTDYGSEQALGQMVALSLTRGVGPVVAAPLCRSCGLGADR